MALSNQNALVKELRERTGAGPRKTSRSRPNATWTAAAAGRGKPVPGEADNKVRVAAEAAW